MPQSITEKHHGSVVKLVQMIWKNPVSSKDIRMTTSCPCQLLLRWYVFQLNTGLLILEYSHFQVHSTVCAPCQPTVLSPAPGVAELIHVKRPSKHVQTQQASKQASKQTNQSLPSILHVFFKMSYSNQKQLQTSLTATLDGLSHPR